MSSSNTRKQPLTERFVVEDEFDPRGNIGEDVESKEEDEGDRGNLIGKTHVQFWSSFRSWSQYWMEEGSTRLKAHILF